MHDPQQLFGWTFRVRKGRVPPDPGRQRAEHLESCKIQSSMTFPLPPAPSPFRCVSRSGPLIARFALTAGMLLTSAAHADIWGYIDDSGRSHLSAEKLDDRYTLFFKGGVRVDQPVIASAQSQGIETSKIESTGASKPLPPALAQFEPLINQYASMHNVDPALVKAVIAVESAFQPGVVSAKGALGLMQIIPGTGQRYGVTADHKKSVQQKLFDPATNLKVGTRYLRDLLSMFAQNVELALAAYNAGEGAVQRHNNKVPPFTETRDYVKRVQKLYADFKPPTPVAIVSPAAAASTSKAVRFVVPGQRFANGLVPIAAEITAAMPTTSLPAAPVTTVVSEPAT